MFIFPNLSISVILILADFIGNTFCLVWICASSVVGDGENFVCDHHFQLNSSLWFQFLGRHFQLLSFRETNQYPFLLIFI